MQDIKLTPKDRAHDISFTNGDLDLVDDRLSRMQVQIGTDARAFEDEVQELGNRRGWLGDELTSFTYGGTTWLATEQGTINNTNAIKARVEAALSLIEDVDLATIIISVQKNGAIILDVDGQTVEV